LRWAGERYCIRPPRFDLARYVGEAQEPKCIQAFLSNPAIEALGERIVAPRVVENDAVL
jgi:hypothetical protein